VDTALERLNRWRDGKLPMPISYTAGSDAFGRDVTEVLAEIERLLAALKRIAEMARRNKPDPDAIYEAAILALKESK
jgi:hypothetical protein